MTVVSQTPPRTGRFAEAALIFLALSIGLGAYALVGLGAEDSIPSSFALIAIVSVVLAYGAHIVIRFFTPFADPILFPSALALNGLGLAMIHRIDLAKETAKASNQLRLSVIALILMTATIIGVRNHRILRGYTWTSLFLGVGLLLLPMAPKIGHSVYGAKIWIRVAGFSFQPAELAKIFFAIFFAGYLVTQRDNLSLAGRKILGIQLPQARHFVPILLAWVVSMGVLAMEKDFGTAILFFGLFVAMLYVATERVSWIVIGGLLSAVGVYFLVQIMPHIQARFVIWLHALDKDVYEATYGSHQLVQGLFGMASGGIFGAGLGQGYPNKVFAAESDFIVASFGEELGLVGLLAILCIYLMIVVRGMRTAAMLRDGFGKLLAAGLSFTIAIQCFVVVGGVTRLIPLTGLAMPFLAHGGSALLTNWIIIGLLLRISDASRRPISSDTLPSPEILASLPSLDEEKNAPSSEDSRLTQVVKL